MSEQPKPTTERLAEALEQAHAPEEMITLARQGHYDDFKSDVAFPIMELVNHARLAGLPDIVQRAMNHEFDATKEESDAWMASADGQATFAQFGHLLPGNRKQRRHPK